MVVSSGVVFDPGELPFCWVAGETAQVSGVSIFPSGPGGFGGFIGGFWEGDGALFHGALSLILVASVRFSGGLWLPPLQGEWLPGSL
jgi:hypothetical protein